MLCSNLNWSSFNLSLIVFISIYLSCPKYFNTFRTVWNCFKPYKQIMDLLSKFESVKFHWLLQCKLTDLTVKRQITDSISENLTDSDLESMPRFPKLIKSKKTTFHFLKTTLKRTIPVQNSLKLLKTNFELSKLGKKRKIKIALNFQQKWSIRAVNIVTTGSLTVHIWSTLKSRLGDFRLATRNAENRESWRLNRILLMATKSESTTTPMVEWAHSISFLQRFFCVSYTLLYVLARASALWALVGHIEWRRHAV